MGRTFPSSRSEEYTDQFCNFGVQCPSQPQTCGHHSARLLTRGHAPQPSYKFWPNAKASVTLIGNNRDKYSQNGSHSWGRRPNRFGCSLAAFDRSYFTQILTRITRTYKLRCTLWVIQQRRHRSVFTQFKPTARFH